MDKGHFVGMVLLDLQKAVDTVDHGILLMKLKALGLSLDVSRWFQSYLSDRQRLVDVSGTHSSHANISCGVPQGSILGSLLFLIYVNDISGAVCNKLLLYADDSAILVADKCLSNTEWKKLIALLNLSSWCLVMVERLFLTVPRGCLQFVIVVFPDHTHLLFLRL